MALRKIHGEGEGVLAKRARPPSLKPIEPLQNWTWAFQASVLAGLLFLLGTWSPALAVEALISNLSRSPEPFSNAVTFSYNLSDTKNIQVGVYNPSGTLVRRLVPNNRTRADTGVAISSTRSVTWDGGDDDSAFVPAGFTYTVRMAAGFNATYHQTVSSAGAQVGDARDIDVDTEGNVYVIQRATGAIIKYSGANGAIIFNMTIPGTTDGTLNFPTGIAVNSPQQKVYVLDTDPDSSTAARVQAFSALDGTFLGESIQSIPAYNDGDVTGGLTFQDSPGTSAGKFLHVCLPGTQNGGRGGTVKAYKFTASISLATLFGTMYDPNNPNRPNANDRVYDAAMDPYRTDTVYFSMGRVSSQTAGRFIYKPYANYLVTSTGWNTGFTTLRSFGSAYNRNNKRLYVAHPYVGAESVAILNGNADQVLGRFTGDGVTALSQPWGVAVSPLDSTIWVVNNGDGLVWQLADSGTGCTVVQKVAPPEGALSNPTDIAVGPDGKLYVVNSGSARVVVYNSDGSLYSEFGSAGTAPGNFTDPFGIAVDTDGYIFVTDKAAEAANPLRNDRIQVFYPWDDATNPLLFYKVAWENDSTNGNHDFGWRGLDFQPVRPNKCPERLYAVTGRVESADNENNGVYVFSIGTNKTLTMVGGMQQNARVTYGSGTTIPNDNCYYFRDVTSDWQGRIYAVQNYLEVDGTNTNAYRSLKTVMIFDSGVAHMDLANGSNVGADSRIDNLGAPLGIVALPYGEVLVSNAKDQTDSSRGNNRVELYHFTDTGYNTVVANTAVNDTRPSWTRPAFGHLDGTDNLSRPTALAYSAGSGANSTDYVWVVDYGNVLIRRYRVEHNAATADQTWEDVDQVTSTRQGTTPTVTAATIAGTNVRTIGTTQYARAGGPCTVTITFSRVMDTTNAPYNNPTVKLVSTVNSNEITATKVSYSVNVLTCTVASLPGSPDLADGRVRITVTGARDTNGTALSPDPTDTDLYSFYYDGTKPSAVHVTQPSTPTSEARIDATGSATDNLKLYRIFVYSDTASTGVNILDTAISQSDNFTSFITWNVTGLALQGAPSSNYIYALAEDAAGNLSDTSDGALPNYDGERRLVVRQALSTGSGRVTPDPDTGYTIGRSARFVIRYTSSQALTGDTITIRVPDGFTKPQSGNPALPGYTLFRDSYNVVNPYLIVNGTETILVGYTSVVTGAWFEIVYGDSASSSNGLTYINNGSVPSEPVPTLGATNFVMTLWDNGDTQYAISGESPPPDLALLLTSESVVMHDTTNLAAAFPDLYAGQANVELLKIRFQNNNGTASGKDVRLTQITLALRDSYGGTLNWNRVFSKVQAGSDTASNIAYYGANSAPGASSNLTIDLSSNNFTVPAGGSATDLYLTGNIASTSSNTDSFQVLVVGSTSFTARVQVDGSNATVLVANETGFTRLPVACGKQKVTTLATPDTLFIGRIASSARVASEDQDEIIPLRLIFSTDTASRPFYIEQLCLRVESGTPAKFPSSFLQSVKLRDDVTGTVYSSKSSVESSGDSMTFNIGFSSANPLTVGGTAAETVTVQVVCKIAASVTNNDTFRLALIGLDTRFIRAYDHPTGQSSPSNQRNNESAQVGVTFPARGGIVTVQKKALVTHYAMRITDLNGADTIVVVQGSPFQVHLGLSAASGRAGAVFRSSDTDLVFYRANGLTNITNEFTITARTATSDSDLSAGSSDTIVYTVVQGSPYSGASETLVVNNYLGSDTGPYAYDFNSQTDATKLRIYAQEGPRDTDFARNDSTYVNIMRASVTSAQYLPGSTGNRVMTCVITDVGPTDTLVAVTIVNTVPAVATMIGTVWIAIDVNKNGSFDSGTDAYFAAGQNFLSSDTLTFIGSRAMAGNGDTLGVFAIVNLETSGITDSTLLSVLLPVNGLGFTGRDSAPLAALGAASYFRTRVVATKLNVSPDTSTNLVDASVVLTVRAEDTYANLDAYGDYAAVSISCRLFDTVTPSTEQSARWTATTLASQSPAALPTASFYDTLVTGSLTSGLATVTLTDSQGETILVGITSGSIPGETARIGFSATPGVSVAALAALQKIIPDSRNVPILVFLVSYPATATYIDSIFVRSENTRDTNVKLLRLWRDANGDGAFDSTVDENLDTGTFQSDGRCSFFVDGTLDSYYKGVSNASVRFFITYDMDTAPLTDGDSLGCRIETGGVRMSGAGFFPTSGELDAVEPDTQNAVVYIDANYTGGGLRWSDPSPGAKASGSAFELYLRAEDKFGNLDALITTPLSDQASKNITFSASPAGITFNSASMTLTTALPATSFTARMKLGQDTIAMTGTLTGNMTITAGNATPPPADTTITLNFTGNEWARASNLSLTDTHCGPGETAVVMRAKLQNITAIIDTVVTVTLTNVGTVRYYDIACVELFADTNGNNTLDTNVDKRLGSGVFNSQETCQLTINDSFAAGESRTWLVVVRLNDTLTTATSNDTVRVRINTSGCSPYFSTSPCPPATMSSPESVAVKRRYLWTMDTLVLSDTSIQAGEVGQVLGRFVLRNYNTRVDTIQRILIRDLGDSFACATNITTVGLWCDANGNSAFDMGVDTFLVNATFTSQETAAFDTNIPRQPYSWDTFFVVASIAASPTALAGDTIRLRYPALGCSTALFGAFPAVNVSYTESIAYQRAVVGITCTHLTVPGTTASGGATNLLIGRYEVRNSKTSSDSIRFITVRNNGSHPDTGLTGLRLFLDANSNGAYDAGVDTAFGRSDSFANGYCTFADSFLLKASGAGDSIWVLVVVNLAVGTTLDSNSVSTRIDTGGVVMISTDTAPSYPISSSYLAGSGQVRTWLTIGGGESVLVSAGTAIVGDSATVTVTVRDTYGSVMQGRLVRLHANGLTVLTQNPVLTDTTGFVTFGVSSASAGAFKCTSTVETTVNPASFAYANFLSAFAANDTAFTSNTQRTTNISAGASRLWSTPAGFSRTTAGRGAELRYNNADYSVYYDVAGAPALIWTVNDYTNFTINNPGPSWTSQARVRTIKGAGTDNVVFGGFSSPANYGVNLYYKPWGAAAGAAPTRFSPNDSRTGVANRDFDTNASFDQFDVAPDGETVLFCMDGDLAMFRPVGATFNPSLDSQTLKLITTFQPPSGYQQPGPWVAYPEFSPDGKRVVMTVLYRRNGWPTAVGPGGTDSAEIYVLKNLSTIAYGSFPMNMLSNVTSLGASQFVRITSATGANGLKFAWQPHWSPDGALILFSADTSGNFNYEAFSQTENPEAAMSAAGVNFNGYMIYYDAATETAPYPPILVERENGVNELIGEMDTGPLPLISYVRSTGPAYYEQRTIQVANAATVNSNGGILFDSGRVAVVIRPDNSYGNGFTIAVRTPDTPTAPTTDSVIISGLAKSFYKPDTPTSPVYFPESVIVYLYYDRRHFSDTDLAGYDSDGDGIPDRTEAAIGAYYYNGTQWVAYPTARFPSLNKIQFWTDHFSEYAVGMPMDARALAFNGTVHEVVAYPNPWRADRAATAALSAGDERYGIKLTNFPGPATRVRVFSLAGELVLDAIVDALNGTSTNSNLRVTAITNAGRGTVSWNLANQSGRAVASGVYLITLDGPGGRAVRKVAVIR